MRTCSKPGCTEGAVATLTYDYADQTAVLGPLATTFEPHTYDLCQTHAQNLTPPRGWQIVRLATKFDPVPPSPDDLMALIEAIRSVADPSGEQRQGGGASAQIDTGADGQRPWGTNPGRRGPQPAEEAPWYSPRTNQGGFQVFEGEEL